VIWARVANERGVRQVKRLGWIVIVALIVSVGAWFVLSDESSEESAPVTTSPEAFETDVSTTRTAGSREEPHEFSSGERQDTLEASGPPVEPVGQVDQAEEQDRTEERADVQRFEELAGSQRFAVPDPDREREARIAVTRQTFGDAGPRACETVCDCEPGEGCDTSAGICIPGLPAGRCCEWEECPFGAPCTTTSGEPSTCE
jgi:hypothetical protein